MPDKGKIMSQTYYERQSNLFNLYKESFARKEMNDNEAAIALRKIGFSESVAAIRVNEWSEQFNSYLPETDKAKKNRLMRQASLEKYVFRMRFGRKHMEDN